MTKYNNMTFLIINGPNLNLTGVREVDVYGETRFEDYLEQLRKRHADLKIEYYQSNVEGELINKLHEVGFTYDGIVFNAGGYTHTSIALADAVSAIKTPVVEVHISNTAKREEFRQISYLAPVCIGSIIGFGLNSYELGIQALLGKR